MRKLILATSAGNIVLGANGRRAQKSLMQLAAMLELPCNPVDGMADFDSVLSTSAPETKTRVWESENRRPFYETPAGNYVVQTDPGYPPHLSGEWQMLLRMGIFRQFRRNALLFPIHGCLLENSAGSGVLCFSHSGAGKSTTTARFRAAGGICRADDMILCGWKDGMLTAHPLPTCSYYSEHWKKDLRYPFQPEIQVMKLCFLQRGATERLIESDSGEWLSALVHSISFHFLSLFSILSSDEKVECGNLILDIALDIAKHFPPLGLEANLSGNIMQTLYGEKR